jgi:sialic acid synthase SpsE
LDRYLFALLASECDRNGLEAAASVFDETSLEVALGYKISHIKIACRPDLYFLVGHVPRQVPVHLSHDFRILDQALPAKVDVHLSCIPEYPAALEDYDHRFDYGVSDHTVGLDLWNRSRPAVWEKHLVLERSDDNPDSGLFALLPEDLEGLL